MSIGRIGWGVNKPPFHMEFPSGLALVGSQWERWEVFQCHPSESVPRADWKQYKRIAQGEGVEEQNLGEGQSRGI